MINIDGKQIKLQIWDTVSYPRIKARCFLDPSPHFVGEFVSSKHVETLYPDRLARNRFVPLHGPTTEGQQGHC